MIWLVLCLNVSAGIGIIGAASPMLQETFAGALVGQDGVGYLDMKKDVTLAASAAAVGAGFVGLISLFNIFGRFFWATSSDYLGRKATYFIFFVLGAGLYVLAAFAADWKVLGLFVLCFCIIASMYGGGFATVPAYLADIFGTQFVGAIHGRLLTAWSTAGIVGPVIVNYLHDTRYAEGIAPDKIYGQIFYILAGLLVVGFIANLLVRPVDPKWHMSDEEVAAEQAKLKSAAGPDVSGSYGIGKGGLDLGAFVFWTLVGVPLAWGVWETFSKALVFFK
jgi:MFS family permease